MGGGVVRRRGPHNDISDIFRTPLLAGRQSVQYWGALPIPADSGHRTYPWADAAEGWKGFVCLQNQFLRERDIYTETTVETPKQRKEISGLDRDQAIPADAATLVHGARAEDFYTSTPEMVLYDWLNQRIGIPWSTDLRILARVVNKSIVGCIGFAGFTGTSCQAHFAGDKPGWLTRGMLRIAFSYVFKDLNQVMLFAHIPSGNVTSLRICYKLGFRTLVVINGAHPDGALHILKMDRADCKWIEV